MSNARRESFRRDGYLVVRSLLGAREVAETRAYVERFVRERAHTLGQHVFYEERGRPETLKQIQLLFQHDLFFARMFERSPFEALAEELLEGPVVGKNMQYFDKPPGAGKPTPPHQDGHYFMLQPMQAVTLWLALDEADEETGSLRYVRGSHLAPLRQHAPTGTLGFSQGVVDYGTSADRAQEVTMHASPGDLLVHHAGTIHSAGGNTSRARHRRALGFIYYSVEARQDEKAHAAYQRDLMQRLEREGRIDPLQGDRP